MLIVDPDEESRLALARQLSMEGFSVREVSGAAGVHQSLAHDGIDLILLDLVLPDIDGLQLAREVRSLSWKVGLIMMANRSDVIDRIVGLEVGADDYVLKPFHVRELIARMKSILRRLQPSAQPVSSAGEPVFSFDGWQFSPSRRKLTSPDGHDVVLTSGEYELLKVFVEHPGQVLTRNQLMDLTRGREWNGLDRVVDAQIVRLRRKIEIDPKSPQLIKSVRGAGYVFASRLSYGNVRVGSVPAQDRDVGFYRQVEKAPSC
ncbi:winged helix-turn-helix domain-containing protein [Methylobacterium sp. J-070]|uniref:winged helix-turn-helix domain-containing protein n=1 Tax=Methylobacterium sp. J-070 TaxID=2836650 RepID=UPI001FB9F0E7|nr:winged helix-turn-helix domain-containing protein [Methylobacterium sp. J-070]MCJ2053856.1 winged helix-turn-helix domain-containing protein [Methylobacterium sp. J-070]